MSFSVKSTKWSIRQNQENDQHPEETDYKDDKSSKYHTYVKQKPKTVSDSYRTQGSTQGIAIRAVPTAMEDYN